MQSLASSSGIIYDLGIALVVQVQNWDSTTAIEANGTGCADTATNPNTEQNLCSFIAYDTLGRRASTTDVLGQVTEFAYDGLGRVVTTTRTLDGQPVQTGINYDALGNTTEYEYAASGNQVAMVDAEGVRKTYPYEGLDRLTSVTENDTGGDERDGL